MSLTVSADNTLHCAEFTACTCTTHSGANGGHSGFKLYSLSENTQKYSNTLSGGGAHGNHQQMKQTMRKLRSKILTHARSTTATRTNGNEEKSRRACQATQPRFQKWFTVINTCLFRNTPSFPFFSVRLPTLTFWSNYACSFN